MQAEQNPYVVRKIQNGLTGHDFIVIDTRTEDQIGSIRTRLQAEEVARSEWAIENGEE